VEITVDFFSSLLIPKSRSHEWASCEGRNFFALRAFLGRSSGILRNSIRINTQNLRNYTYRLWKTACLPVAARSKLASTTGEICWRMGSGDIY
jgi:hypothetical protein